LRSAATEEFLIRQVVDRQPVGIRRDEDDVFDVVFVDEPQEFVALGRVTLVAIARPEDGAEILDCLGKHDELPRDALVARIQKSCFNRSSWLSPSMLRSGWKEFWRNEMEGNGSGTSWRCTSSGSRNERASTVMIAASEPYVL
jgi:hypothetical protein